ncbi:MAG: hypothetical protein Q8O46_05230, partial [bacterium]|nr:hypothetical protein [bacterium]
NIKTPETSSESLESKVVKCVTNNKVKHDPETSSESLELKDINVTINNIKTPETSSESLESKVVKRVTNNKVKHDPETSSESLKLKYINVTLTNNKTPKTSSESLESRVVNQVKDNQTPKTSSESLEFMDIGNLKDENTSTKDFLNSDRSSKRTSKQEICLFKTGKHILDSPNPLILPSPIIIGAEEKVKQWQRTTNVKNMGSRNPGCKSNILSTINDDTDSLVLIGDIPISRVKAEEFLIKEGNLLESMARISKQSSKQEKLRTLREASAMIEELQSQLSNAKDGQLELQEHIILLMEPKKPKGTFQYVQSWGFAPAQ